MKNWLHNMICGAGTLLEIMPPTPKDSFQRTKKVLSRSDAEAIYGDWEKIGQDFWSAIRQVDREIHGNGNGSIQSSKPGSPRDEPTSSRS